MCLRSAILRPFLKALTVSKKNQRGMRTKMNDGDNVNDDDDRVDIISRKAGEKHFRYEH